MQENDDKSTKMENFYSCGDKHILFWVKKGRGYVSKKGTFPKASKEKGKKRKKNTNKHAQKVYTNESFHRSCIILKFEIQETHYAIHFLEIVMRNSPFAN